MEDFYPQAIYHGVNYFPVIDTSEDFQVSGKNFYRVLQLDKGKLREVSTGFSAEEIANDFSIKINQGCLPKGQIQKYLQDHEGIKSPLADKVKQFSITKDPGKIIPLSPEEDDSFRKNIP